MRQTQCCFARRSASDARAAQCLLRLAAGGCESARRRPTTLEGYRPAASHSRPRRVVAIVKADVRRPDTGRVVRHALSRRAPERADDCMDRMMRKSNHARSPSDAALLLL